MMWTAGLAGPGKVTLLGDGEIELENLEPEGEAFTKKVVEVFQEAKLNPIYSHNVRYNNVTFPGPARPAVHIVIPNMIFFFGTYFSSTSS